MLLRVFMYVYDESSSEILSEVTFHRRNLFMDMYFDVLYCLLFYNTLDILEGRL